MRITDSVLAAYRRALAAQAGAASEYVAARLEAFFEANPAAGVADVRDEMIRVLGEALEVYGDAAQSVACDFLDYVMAGEGLEGSTALVDEAVDMARVERKARWLAGLAESASLADVARRAGEAAGFFVRRSAYEGMRANCGANGVRYARVPSGAETCPFCLMLASRGFVYLSEETARGTKAHGVHQHCDCVVVPGVQGVTQVDGYDPDALYRRWKTYAQAAGADSGSGGAES